MRDALRRAVLTTSDHPAMPLAATGAVALATAALSRRSLGSTRALGLGAVAGAATGWALLADRVAARTQRAVAADAADAAYRQAEALGRVYAELRGDVGLPPMRGWALSPDAATVVLDAVAERRPEVVVDLGSGTTTLLLALLARTGAPERIISVDHDADYLARTARLLHDAGVADHVELVHAPLTEVDVDGHREPWYDLAGGPTPERVDLLIVDGPPRTASPTARHPALGWFAPALHERSLVVLDDADRAGEREVVRRWMAHHPELVVAEVPTEKGCAVLHHRDHRPALLDRRAP